MKIPVPFIVIAITAVVGLQSWTLKEVVNLKVEVASIKTKLSMPVTASAPQTQLAKTP